MKTREPRKRTMIPARLRGDGPQSDITILDVSARGLMVSGDPSLRRGTYVEISRPGLSIIGCVVWARGGRAGIRARDPIDLSRPVSGPGTASRGAVNSAHLRVMARPDAASLAEDSRNRAELGQFALVATTAGLAASALILLAFTRFAAVADAIAAPLR